MFIVFIVVSYLLAGLVLLFSPKRLTKQEIYMAWIIISFITLLSDTIFGLLLDQYDLLDGQGPQPLDLFVELTLPALFGILYMNFMPGETRKFILYMVFWIVFSVLYEQFSRYTGYVNYKGWNGWYSALFYLFACLFMRWHFRFIRKGITKD